MKRKYKIKIDPDDELDLYVLALAERKFQIGEIFLMLGDDYPQRSRHLTKKEIKRWLRTVGPYAGAPGHAERPRAGLLPGERLH